MEPATAISHSGERSTRNPANTSIRLLGALITGAARLMLALAEHQVAEQGLDWHFATPTA